MNDSQNRVVELLVETKMHLDFGVDCDDISLCKKASERMKELVRAIEAEFECGDEISRTCENNYLKLALKNATFK